MNTRAAPCSGRRWTNPILYAFPSLLTLMLAACPADVTETPLPDTGNRADSRGDSVVPDESDAVADGSDAVSDESDVTPDENDVTPDENDVDPDESDSEMADLPLDAVDSDESDPDAVEGELVLRTARIGGSNQASGSDTFVLVGGLTFSQHLPASGGEFSLVGGL